MRQRILGTRAITNSWSSSGITSGLNFTSVVPQHHPNSIQGWAPGGVGKRKPKFRPVCSKQQCATLPSRGQHTRLIDGLKYQGVVGVGTQPDTDFHACEMSSESDRGLIVHASTASREVHWGTFRLRVRKSIIVQFRRAGNRVTAILILSLTLFFSTFDVSLRVCGWGDSAGRGGMARAAADMRFGRHDRRREC